MSLTIGGTINNLLLLFVLTDADILNGLQWTAALDDHFRKNYEQDKQMMWQFFGSQTGFMRTYPASRWNTHGQVDLFDVRRQSW